MLDRVVEWLYTRCMGDSTHRYEYDGTVIIEVHHFYHTVADDEAQAGLERIAGALHVLDGRVSDLVTTLTRRDAAVSVQLDALRSEVERNSSVDQSVATLLDGLTQRIAALEPTQAAIDALVNELRSSNDVTAAAVTRNTPAEAATPSTGPTPPPPGTITGGEPGGTNLDPTPPPTAEPTSPSGEPGSETGGTGSAGTGEGEGTTGTGGGSPTP